MNCSHVICVVWIRDQKAVGSENKMGVLLGVSIKNEQ